MTSFIGCFGAHLENTGFLNTYSSITAIALIMELSKVFYINILLEMLIINLVAMGLAYTHQIQVRKNKCIMYSLLNPFIVFIIISSIVMEASLGIFSNNKILDFYWI